jgi:hypothetical protein
MDDPPKPTIDKSTWIVALCLFLFTSGGMFWAFLWLLRETIKFDKTASAWSKHSFAKFKEQMRKQKEAEDDIHSIGDQ